VLGVHRLLKQARLFHHSLTSKHPNAPHRPPPSEALERISMNKRASFEWMISRSASPPDPSFALILSEDMIERMHTRELLLISQRVGLICVFAQDYTRSGSPMPEHRVWEDRDVIEQAGLFSDIRYPHSHLERPCVNLCPIGLWALPALLNSLRCYVLHICSA